MQDKQQLWGTGAAIAAYLVWGFLPLYWKMVDNVPSGEVLAHRIIWSLGLMVLFLFLIGKLKGIIQEIIKVFSSRTSMLAITAAAIFISCNWFLFIFSVNSDRVNEVSLGYYINPLINVLLATLFLKEKLSVMEKAAFILAIIGVVVMTLSYGYLPWAGLGLALSFGIYGLIKKTLDVGAWAGLTIETLLMTPFALLFLAFFRADNEALFHYGTEINILLIVSGAATAVPLLLFAAGARRISLSLLGFLQYLAPTIMLVLGVFVFRELFSTQQLIAFVTIWIGLLLFTISRSNATFRQRKEKMKAEKAV
ncbi:EamA family transporter RarD [Alteribacillus iranensis]|uniref:Chloramphenicol-sensitive protein RarD n=1 Tax=Alteribacillus iranensis TaxID=930128 RepID=A0A1I2DKD7_9BACI|nr:EamA family transporter RarD [Alteribacillus iranensis]SFE81065.1 chloramphenicol-sensitive protein RarD [Alteribacillus iranensis]